MPIPTFSGPETLIEPNTAGMPPDVVGLPNGNYVLVWTEPSQIIGNTGDTSIKGQLYNADGSRLGEFLVNQVTAGWQDFPAVAALSDGRFVATWADFGNSGIGDIKARIFNADGTPAGNEFTVNTLTPGTQFEPAVAGLAGGGFAITWTSIIGTPPDNVVDVAARAFDANGVALGAEFVVDNSFVEEREPAIAGLSNGNYAIVWYDQGSPFLDFELDGESSHIRGHIFSGNGSDASGGEFIVNSTTVRTQSQPAIASLDNGTFVVTWSHIVHSWNSDVRARVFSNAGVPLAADFVVDEDSAGAGGNSSANESHPAVTALGGGSYLIAWSDDGAGGETDGSGFHVRGEVFSGALGNGGSSSDEFIINTTTPLHQHDPVLATLADGRVIALWDDESYTPPTIGFHAIRGQLLDPHMGSWTLSNDDRLYGGAGSDRLFGYDGNDLLFGRAGNDRLDGGVGNDRLFGENGNDLLLGRAGNDRLDGGASDDRLIGDSGNDLLLGRAGNDVIDGGAGDDCLLGDNGRDLLFGRSGNDRLYGGAGNDVLTGGRGRDVSVGGAGADRFDFNELAESVIGARRDVVFFERNQGDKIDLSTIDADTDGTAGNQRFAFIGGSAFTGVDGQLRFSGGLLQGDTNGDGVADIEIRIVGALVGSDIVL